MNSDVLISSVFSIDADILPPSDDRILKPLLIHQNVKKVLIDVTEKIYHEKEKKKFSLSLSNFFVTELSDK